MTAGWFPARGRKRCFMIQKKRLSAGCGCCAKARYARLKEATSRCAARQFAFTATHPAQLNSRVNCENDWNRKASGSARRRGPSENQSCHSKRSEESQVAGQPGSRISERCFALLNMTG